MNVFLSYSSSDREFAGELAKCLQTRGLTVWMDKECLRPGQNWEKEIKRAVEESEAFVLLFSPSTGSEKSVLFEWNAILEHAWKIHDAKVIPILLGQGKVPTFVKSLARTVCQVEGGDTEHATECVLQTLSGRPDQTGHLFTIDSVDADDLKERKERFEFLASAIEGMKGPDEAIGSE